MFVNEITNLEIDVKLAINNNIKNKCFSKRVAKRIRNLQAKFINTRMSSFWMYVSVSWGAFIKKMEIVLGV